MAKLYPPYIEGTIPAFTGTTIVVPFSLNKANSTIDIKGFSLRIKTVQNNIVLATLTQTNSQYYNLYTDFNVSFILEQSLLDLLNIGQFYKIQLAFINQDNEVGYYSTVGIIKYTTYPEISISGLKRQDNSNIISTINRHIYTYIGNYNQKNGDTTEKIYSSRFILTDSHENVVIDSGDIIHNSSKDINSYEASEKYTISQELEENKSYYIKYIVTTINKLTAESPTYRIMQQNPVHPDLYAEVTAAVNFEEGFIDVGLVSILNKKGEEVPATGSFILSRAASNTNWTWQNITSFVLQAQKPNRFLWRDFTVEQGVEYQYAVQQYSDNQIYSQRIKSPIVMADFEDAFLYDGKRQLKIRFNPKVSSFKDNIPEQKIDTIGSKYPYIFRNGKVYYKEFPISGLISYQMDENKLFYPITPRADLASHPYDITSEDLYKERDFKLEVLEWLNNGKLKIFKSPSEGNYFVRLLNVSLTPMDSLGRMLHTFNCTAYEMYDYTYDNLVEKNFVNAYISQERVLRLLTIELSCVDEKLNNLLKSLRDYSNAGVSVSFTPQQYSRICNHAYYVGGYKFDYSNLFIENNGNYIISAHTLCSSTNGVSNLTALEHIIDKVTYLTGQINSYPVYSIFIQDMMPGQRVELIVDNETTESIQIGSRGSYIADFENSIQGIVIPEEKIHRNAAGDIVELNGSITYGYYSEATNIFNTIADATIVDVPCEQFIGLPSKTFYSVEEEKNVTTNNLIEIIEDVKKDIVQIFSLKFSLRPIVKIYFQDRRLSNINKNNLQNSVFYWDMNCTQKITNINELFPNYIYAICRARYDYSFTEDVLFEQSFFDATTGYNYYAEIFNNYEAFYVDTFDNRVKLFTGYYLDGRSTNENIIIFDTESCTRKFSINGDVIDLTHIRQYELSSDFDASIKSILFDNGTICEISYQYSEITYLMENTNNLIKSKKDYYQTYYNYWLQLHLDEEDSIIYNNSNLIWLNDDTVSLNTFVANESNINTLIQYIKNLYQNYVDFLALSLKQYKEEHALL